MSALLPFQQRQLAFAAAIRDGQLPIPEGIDPERLQLYRELVFNNLLRTISRAFPVARNLLPEAQWLALVQAFGAGHRSDDPLLHQLPAAFLDFVAQCEDVPAPFPACLPELLHYEWAETVLLNAPLEPPPAQDVLEPLDAPLQLSPLAGVHAYDWPVHRLCRDYLPALPPALPSFIVLNRNRHDAVQFLEIDAFGAALLEALQEQPGQTGRAALAALAAARHWSLAPLLPAASRLLRQLLDRDALIVAPPAA